MTSTRQRWLQCSPLTRHLFRQGVVTRMAVFSLLQQVHLPLYAPFVIFWPLLSFPVVGIKMDKTTLSPEAKARRSGNGSPRYQLSRKTPTHTHKSEAFLKTCFLSFCYYHYSIRPCNREQKSKLGKNVPQKESRE